MKPIVFAVALILNAVCCAQPPANTRNEFSADGTGLMYPGSEMARLRKIVDSLNIRYKVCDQYRSYRSLPQAYSYYVEFSSKKNRLTSILQSLENNEEFEAVVLKYKAFINKLDSADLLIMYKDHCDSATCFKLLHGSPLEGYQNVYNEDSFSSQFRRGRWVYDYSPKDEYSEEYSISARFIPGNFQQKQIPLEYSRLVEYVDCMIDTSAQIYLSRNYEHPFDEEAQERKNSLYPLKRYLKNHYPEVPLGSSVENFSFIPENCDKLKNDNTFLELLFSAVDSVSKKSKPDYWLEAFTNALGFYDKALLLKRSYTVMGMCSQDSRPREHARDIAILAAKSTSWDIFLRAHLDIMNDRFERMSDGSYAYDQRKTYLKELEELNLNVVDLMLGLTLRAQDLPENHYYGTIWRLGWALTESRERKRFEESAITMIKDDRLDDFNRGLIYILYASYLTRLDDQQEARSKINLLKKHRSEYPWFIQSSIVQLDIKDSERN